MGQKIGPTGFSYSNHFNGQYLHCNIECDIENVQYAFYVELEGKAVQKYWYSSKDSIIHDCGNDIIHTYNITYFVKKDNGQILSIIKQYRTNWSLCDGAIEAVKQLSNLNTNTLEFGSGYGSSLVSQFTNLFSVEHEEAFVGEFSGVNYIYAPLEPILPLSGFDETCWYSAKVIKTNLPENCNLVIVDGPPEKYGRSGLLRHLNLFSSKTVWIVDDVLRDKDQRLANVIALHFSLIQYRFWNFSILSEMPLKEKQLSSIHNASLSSKANISKVYINEYYPKTVF